MDHVKPEEAMKELTLILLYLSRFTRGEKFEEASEFYAWKGFDFDVLNQLSVEEYIIQGSYRSKSVTITDTGLEKAEELLSKYGISDWVKKQGFYLIH